jgi:MFS family permease
LAGKNYAGLSSDSYQLTPFRFLEGIGLGSGTMLAPTYVSENSPRAIRGFLVGFFQLLLDLGGMTAYVSAPGPGTKDSAGFLILTPPYSTQHSGTDFDDSSSSTMAPYCTYRYVHALIQSGAFLTTSCAGQSHIHRATALPGHRPSTPLLLDASMS